MPTFLERQTATPEGLALAVTELRARIEERRNAAWQPEPGETVHERRMHWELVAERRTTKIAEGEFIEDELLPQLRDDKDMNRSGPGISQGCRARQRARSSALILRKDSRPTTKTGRRKKRRCIFLPPSKRARCCASFSIADFAISCCGTRAGGSRRNSPICSGTTPPPRACFDQQQRRGASRRDARTGSGSTTQRPKTSL